VASGLFASLEPPRLAGSRCSTCATIAFPVQSGCAKCAGSDVETVELADTGTLWTWTVQAIEPKAPYLPPELGFEPYGVGYVDLGDIIVEGRLVGEQSRFEIGMPMRLTLLPVRTDGDETIVTYAFEPAGSQE
jgi:uncharacterized OB-fold protein